MCAYQLGHPLLRFFDDFVLIWNIGKVTPVSLENMNIQGVMKVLYSPQDNLWSFSFKAFIFNPEHVKVGDVILQYIKGRTQRTKFLFIEEEKKSKRIEPRVITTFTGALSIANLGSKFEEE